MDGLEVGSIVRFVLSDGTVRPMIVTAVLDEGTGMVNGVVFRDGANDDRRLAANGSATEWVSSVHFDPAKKARSWHWPGQAATAMTRAETIVAADEQPAADFIPPKRAERREKTRMAE